MTWSISCTQTQLDTDLAWPFGHVVISLLRDKDRGAVYFFRTVDQEIGLYLLLKWAFIALFFQKDHLFFLFLNLSLFIFNLDGECFSFVKICTHGPWNSLW